MPTDDVVLNKAAVVRKAKLGIPQDSRNAFDLLVRAGHLDPQLAEDMKRMVGCRNVAVRDYVRLDLEIVQSIIEQHLDDLGSLRERVDPPRAERLSSSAQPPHSFAISSAVVRVAS